MSKTRSDAKLKTLPAETQAAMWAFFEEDKKRKLADAVPWLRSEFDVVTNVKRLSEWRDDYARALRIDNADDFTTQFISKLQQKPHLKLAPETLAAISNSLFLEVATRDQDVKSFAIAAGVIQRAQELEASRIAHSDKMEVSREKLKLQHSEMERKNRELEMKLAEFEREQAAARLTAERAKAKIEGSQMNDDLRAQLMAEMDHLILGKPKPETKRAAKLPPQ